MEKSSILSAELLRDIEAELGEGQDTDLVDTDLVDTKPQIQNVDEKELRRQRLAEMARLRYQNLSTEEKKAVNSRRMLLRKRKRQREREMEELEVILRQSNDIEEDVVFIGDIREKRQRESRAKAARSRYQNMSSEERRNYNQKRRIRQPGMAEGSGELSGINKDMHSFIYLLIFFRNRITRPKRN